MGAFNDNVLNALFMVVSWLLLVGLLSAGVAIPWVFVLLALLNLGVAFYVYTVIPELLLRFAAWVLAHLLYRIRLRGDERIPAELEEGEPVPPAAVTAHGLAVRVAELGGIRAAGA